MQKNEQNFNGFLMLPHNIIQAFITKHLAGCEIQVLFVIIALTYGYHRKSAEIKLVFFEKSTGLKKQQIHDLLKKLQKRNIIFIHKKNHNFYELNLNWENWESSKTNHKALGIYKKKTMPTILNLQTNTNDFLNEPYQKNSTTNKDNIKNKTNINNIIKESDESTKELIIFAQQECKIAIIGNQVRLLKELLALKGTEALKLALKNFAEYHSIPKTFRSYTISRNFFSFSNKIDCFLSKEDVEQRINSEKRWYKEAKAINQDRQEETNRDEFTVEKLPETANYISECERKIDLDRLTWLKNYVKKIDTLSSELMLKVEQVCARRKEPILKYLKALDLIKELEKKYKKGGKDEI